MDIPWGSEAAHKFATNVGLITSNGPNGHNIMAAEWTHHISYSPGLIAVFIGHKKATLENIHKSKEFGVSMAALDQNVLASISGGSSGRDVDKIATLKELGFKLKKAKKIDVWMPEGSAFSAECKVVNEMPLGDHTMVVGEVLDFSIGKKDSVIYHQGKYWKVGEKVEKPPDKDLELINSIVEKHRKK